MTVQGIPRTTWMFNGPAVNGLVRRSVHSALDRGGRAAGALQLVLSAAAVAGALLSVAATHGMARSTTPAVRPASPLTEVPTQRSASPGS